MFRKKVDIRLIKVPVEIDAEDMDEIRRYCKGFDITPEIFVRFATRFALEQLRSKGNAYMTEHNIKV